MTTELNPLIRRALRVALYGAGALTAGMTQSSLALAQNASSGSAAKANSDTLEEVIVTGSRIAAPNLASVSPITMISSDEVKQTGLTRVEDLINSLPQVVADQDSGLSMGSNGTATINLRGLGTQRTLVLMNGRRLQGGDPGATLGSAPGGASSADINQIPVALIERVDVLTGGASATYGADAVAGVVNFVMNDHFEGVRVDLNGGIYNHNNHQGSLINPLLAARKFPTVNGGNTDGSNVDVSVIMGHAFADGAGSMEGYLTYRHEAPITADHRDHAACVLDHHTHWSCAGSSNSAPTVFYDFSTGDAVSYQIAPDGTVKPKYARFNYAASHYLQRIDDRYAAGLFGKLQLGAHAEAYMEFTFMDDKTQGAYAPAGAFLGSGKSIDSVSGLVDGNMTVNCGVGAYGNAGMNPYLTNSEWTKICNFAPYDSKHVPAGAPAYQIDAKGNAQLLLARRNIEGGPRQDNYTHTAYRGVFGVKGKINEDWNYDTYALFSKTSSTQFHNNDTSTSRMQNAILALPGPNGTVVCAGGQADCVPWNIWNPAIPVDPKSLAYFSVPGIFNAESQEDIVSGYVTGDLTSRGVKTPWASDGLKVVFGIEGRRDTLDTFPDAELQFADLAGNGSPVPPVTAQSHVWEGFTEARLPLANKLDFETGYRYSDYSAGFNTSTYKFGLTWSPISSMRLRASYNRSVRVPNLQELYQPDHVGLDSGGDLCNIYSSFTPAQCAATGLTGGTLAPVSPASQYNGLIGGNVKLQPEVGKTVNAGLVFTPSAMPGFSATIDYTDIKIDNLVSSYGPNLIQANCVASANINSSWCQLIHRDSAGSLWASPQGYTYDVLLNNGSLENKSVDLGLAYRFKIGRFGGMRSRLDGGYLLKLLNTPGGGAKTYDCAGLFGPSCSPATPKWRHRMTIDWDTPHDGLSFGLTWRYFGSSKNSLLDRSTPDYAPGNFTDTHIPTHSLLDLRTSYTIDKVILRLGVNNALDKDPPLIDTQNSGGNTIYAESNTYPGMYDSNGRYIYFNATIDF